MRKLASIRTINNLKSIPNADKIELAIIDGWQCVVKKGEFKVDDKCIYFEIDSVLPSSDKRFKFLTDKLSKEYSVEDNKIVHGHRLRTVKLKNQISQGLALPISNFPETIGIESSLIDGILGIKKFELPISTHSEAKGAFPSFIKKTDQERIQNIIHEIDFNSDEKWEITEKLDGCSATYFYNNGETGICSRNMLLKEEGNTLWHKIEREHEILDRLRSYGKNIAIQGEIIGNNIQGNPHKIDGLKFYVFDIFDIDNYKKLLPYRRRSVLTEVGGLKHIFVKSKSVRVDIFARLVDDVWTFDELGHNSLDDVLSFGNKYTRLCRIGDITDIANVGEGWVFKSYDREFSFKVINNQYLLNEEQKIMLMHGIKNGECYVKL